MHESIRNNGYPTQVRYDQHAPPWQLQITSPTQRVLLNDDVVLVVGKFSQILAFSMSIKWWEKYAAHQQERQE
jgi:hypothetical protein